jgi:hypothetical protein
MERARMPGLPYLFLGCAGAFGMIAPSPPAIAGAIIA